MIYVNQLPQEKQDFIKSRLQANLSELGLEGIELAEAVQNGLDGTLNDLDEHLTYNELNGLKEVEFLASEEQIMQVIRTREPRNLFISKGDKGGWVVCDNTNGNAYVEDFLTIDSAFTWLLDGEA